jgi:hypothetical protein
MQGQSINNLSSTNILFDGNSFIFSDVNSSNNIELDKRKNIVSLAKLILGGYLSAANGFRDFSSVDDSWFIQNLDDICETITDDNFDQDYFYSLFTEGNNEYYCDYLERKKQSESIGGKGNIRSYKKVLSNAASNFYEDQTEVDDLSVEKKTAQVTPIFYPLLIGMSLATVLAMYLIFKYL